MVDTAADVVVIGAGLAGSASAWALRQRGHRVVVLDQFEGGHARGSSHGTERIFRLSYPDVRFVRMARDSLNEWHALGLLHTTGMVDHGSVPMIAAIEAACADVGVATERVDVDEAARRWPAMRVTDPVLVQADGGRLDAEGALAAFRTGVDVRFGVTATRIEPGIVGLTVTTSFGDILRADAVVAAPGSWAPALLDGLVDLPPITVTNETVAFFRPHQPTPIPSFVHWAVDGTYGLSTPDGLVKVGGHGIGPAVDPDDRPTTASPEAVEHLVGWVRAWMPGIDPAPVRSHTCLYATAPNDDFIIERHGRIVVCAGLGGHGFKFGPTLGRQVADLVDEALG